MNYKILTEKKNLLDKARPLPSALIDNLEGWFRVELTYNSNAIEGNTLTRQETALVVEKGITVGGKSLIEHLEAINHTQALDWIKNKVSYKPSSITEKNILSIHEMILKNIDDINAGCYRTVAVRISGSTVILPNPIKVPRLMSKFIDWLQSSGDLHPAELAAEVHYQLVTIHPFTDGNGRTARLLMNMILMMCGYPPAIIRKQERLDYINSLEKAQLGGSKEPYYKIIANAIDRSLNIYLKALDGKISKFTNEEKLLKIGELAKIVGESNSTIRHWTKEGLLSLAQVTQSGYQLYSNDMVKRISLIKKLKSQRFTLKEIKEKILES